MGQRAERRLVVDGDGAAQALGERVARAEPSRRGRLGARSTTGEPAPRTVGRAPPSAPVRGAGRRAQQRGEGEADAEHRAPTSASTSAASAAAPSNTASGASSRWSRTSSAVRAHHAVQPDRAHRQRVDVDGHPERDRSARREPHGPRRAPDPPRRGRVLGEHPGAQQRLQQGRHRGPGEPGARGQLGPRRAARGPQRRQHQPEVVASQGGRARGPGVHLAPVRCSTASWCSRTNPYPRAPAASASKSSNAERSASSSV